MQTSQHIKTSIHLSILLLLVAATFIPVTAALAGDDDPPPDVEQPSGIDHEAPAAWGQSFEATGDGEITEIGVALNGDSSDQTLVIYEGNGVSTWDPSSGAAYTQTGINLTGNYDPAITDYSGNYQTITLDTPLPVIGGQQYTFYLTGNWEPVIDWTDPYANGSIWDRNFDYSAFGHDATFIVVINEAGEVTIVPVKATTRPRATSHRIPKPIRIVPKDDGSAEGAIGTHGVFIPQADQEGSLVMIPVDKDAVDYIQKRGGLKFIRPLRDIIYRDADGKRVYAYPGILYPYFDLDYETNLKWEAGKLDMYVFDGQSWQSCNPYWIEFGQYGRLSCITSIAGTFGLALKQ